MAHHSADTSFPPEFLRSMLGPTGKFPDGKLTDSDEGEIAIAVGSKDGKVVIDFGKPTAWIGFTPAQANDIADLLRKHAASVV